MYVYNSDYFKGLLSESILPPFSHISRNATTKIIREVVEKEKRAATHRIRP